MIKYAFIAPKAHLEESIARSDVNMALAHLCGDYAYTKSFAESEKYTILDNSFFELGYSLPVADLLTSAEKVKADCIVLPDGTVEGITKIKLAGYQVMYIPTTGEEYKEAMESGDIDLIGLSSYWCAKSLGLDKNDYAARRKFLDLYDIGGSKKIHVLGATDSLAEIELLRPYHDLINSWDSSAAIWSGINGLSVKEQKKKFTETVDFDSDLGWTSFCETNINYIKGMLK